MGYEKIITYTLASENGASLRASGWMAVDGLRGGGNWNVPGRPRTDMPLAATRWAAVTVFFGGLRTLLVALPLPLPFSSRPHAVPSSNFINADQSKPSFDILLKSGMSGWGWGLVFSFRRGDDVGSYAVWSCEGSACTVSSWAGAGAYAVGVAGTGVAGFTFRVGFFGAGAYVCPAAW